MTTLWAANEDEAVSLVGASFVDTSPGSNVRTVPFTFSRCALVCGSINSGNYILSPNLSLTQFYAHGVVTLGNMNGDQWVFAAFDSNSIVRLYAKSNSNSPQGISLYTMNAAGSSTLLVAGTAPAPEGSLCTMDVYVNYSSGGSFQLFFDGVLMASYNGNITTDGVTLLQNIAYGGWDIDEKNYWSELCIDTVSTLGLGGVVTLVPTANGNTDNWDVGGVTNVNEAILNEVTYNASGTANQVQEYTVSTPPSGIYTLRSVVVSALALCGTSGPQHIEMMVRTGGTDYNSSSIALTNAYANVQGIWATNPNTSTTWQSADIQNTGFETGMESIT